MTLRGLPPSDIGEPEYKNMLLAGKRAQFYAKVCLFGFKHASIFIVLVLHRILSILWSSFNFLKTVGTRSISSDLQQLVFAELFNTSLDLLMCHLI